MVLSALLAGALRRLSAVEIDKRVARPELFLEFITQYHFACTRRESDEQQMLGLHFAAIAAIAIATISTASFSQSNAAHLAGSWKGAVTPTAPLNASIYSKADHEIMVETARIVALAGDGHTSLSLTRNRTGFRGRPP